MALHILLMLLLPNQAELLRFAFVIPFSLNLQRE